jgi:O-succinylhomoserine sulfhydrylase
MERRLAALEGTRAASPPASGMAAILLLMMALLKAATTWCARAACSARRSSCFQEFAKFGVETSFVSQTDLAEWRAALRPEHQAAVRRDADQPADRGLRHPALADIAHGTARCWLVDNCFCSPALQQPVKFGADLVMHSGTKFLDGQGRVIAGALCGSAELVDAKFVPVMRSAGMTCRRSTPGWCSRAWRRCRCACRRRASARCSWRAGSSSTPQVARVYLPGPAVAPAARAGDGAARRHRRRGGVVRRQGRRPARANAFASSTPRGSAHHRQPGRHQDHHHAPGQHLARPPDRGAAPGGRHRPGLIRLGVGLEMRDLKADLQRARAGRSWRAVELPPIPCRERTRSAPASPRRPPASCTWAPPAPRCIPGPLRATTAASSCCASRTPTSPARRRIRSTRSSAAMRWLGWTTTRARLPDAAPGALPRGGRADAGRRHRLPLLVHARGARRDARSAAARGEKPRYDGRWRPEPGKVLPAVPKACSRWCAFATRWAASSAGTTWSRARSASPTRDRRPDHRAATRRRARPTTSRRRRRLGHAHHPRLPRRRARQQHALADQHLACTGGAAAAVRPLPMILGDDGDKLSKRHGAVSVTPTRRRLPARGHAQLPGAPGLEPWRRRAVQPRADWCSGSTAAPGQEPGAMGSGQAGLGQRALHQAGRRRALAALVAAQLARRGWSSGARRCAAARRCALFKDRCATVVELADWPRCTRRRCSRAPRTWPRMSAMPSSRRWGLRERLARHRLGHRHDRRGDEGHAGRARAEDAAAGAAVRVLVCARTQTPSHRRRAGAVCARARSAALAAASENCAIIMDSLEQRARRKPEGGIAQLGERLHGMQEVSGSIPLTSTKAGSQRVVRAMEDCSPLRLEA